MLSGGAKTLTKAMMNEQSTTSLLKMPTHHNKMVRDTIRDIVMSMKVSATFVNETALIESNVSKVRLHDDVG
jgi:hypothetical protein